MKPTQKPTMTSLRFMAEKCELYKLQLIWSQSKAFCISRPPYWENPQEWPKDDILVAIDFIIEASKMPETKSAAYYEVKRKAADDFIWIENAVFALEKIQYIERKINETKA